MNLVVFSWGWEKPAKHCCNNIFLSGGDSLVEIELFAVVNRYAGIEEDVMSVLARTVDCHSPKTKTPATRLTLRESVFCVDVISTKLVESLY